jgi:hypothetical protein
VNEAGEKVTIELTAEEALVLFELLSRWRETGVQSILLHHQAEQRVLWDILATLESTLVEPFMPDYQDQLNKAREMVKDDLG